MHYFIRSFLVWLVFVPLAILNGVVRDVALAPLLGDSVARAISSLSLSVLIFCTTVLFVHRLGVGTKRGYVIVGLFWLLLTLLFEFSFFVLVMGHPLDELLRDYDIFQGRIWVLVLAATFLSPLLASRLRKRPRR
jgi:hypothetical protein